VLCEGVATAAAVHGASGLCAVAAFSKGELVVAAKAVRTRWPRATLVIGADADPDGGGEAAARHAARAAGATVVLPPRPAAWTGPGWDFADLWEAGEADAIRMALGIGG
jgi:putative DNA primase/helicase